MPQLLELSIDNKIFKEWLYCKTPITTKLSNITNNAEIKLLEQNWSLATLREQSIFAPNLNNIFRREVTINTNNRPCWYAKAVIPEQTFNNNKKIFSKLEETTLGHLIFNEPSIERVNLQPIQFFTKENCFIGRVTTYKVATQQNKFYMLELFLPYFKEVINEKYHK